MSKSSQAPRLGRGLSSLISVSETPVERSIPPSVPAVGGTDGASGVRVLELPIDSIVPNPHQPRRSMNDAGLTELAASIKATGVIQPILVRRTADGVTQLIAGERRWRASKLAGLTTIPAIIKEVDGLTQAQMALIENIQREDLNPIDRAAGYRTLITQLGLTQNELAGRLGEDRTVISNHLRLLDLEPRVQQMVADGRLTVGHAKLLGGISDLTEQVRLAQLCVSQALSVRNLERAINGTSSPQPKPTTTEGARLHLLEVERSLARHLGMRVAVRSRGKRGSVTIHYANLDQFDQLIDRLGVKLES